MVRQLALELQAFRSDRARTICHLTARARARLGTIGHGSLADPQTHTFPESTR